MKKIRLFCSAGMSTSLLVNKMQEAAKNKGIEVDIFAYSEAEVAEKGEEADVILLGPQIKYRLKAITEIFPHKPIDVIEMRTYGLMDGNAVLDKALELMGQ